MTTNIAVHEGIGEGLKCKLVGDEAPAEFLRKRVGIKKVYLP
jgi:hypothetical protein